MRPSLSHLNSVRKGASLLHAPLAENSAGLLGQAASGMEEGSLCSVSAAERALKSSCVLLSLAKHGFLCWGQAANHPIDCTLACAEKLTGSFVISLLCLQLTLGCEHSETYPWEGYGKGPGTDLTLTMEKMLPKRQDLINPQSSCKAHCKYYYSKFPSCSYQWTVPGYTWPPVEGDHTASGSAGTACPTLSKEQNLVVSSSTAERTSVMFSLDK